MQRANPGMPDMISSDGEDYKLRRDLLREVLFLFFHSLNLLLTHATYRD